MKKEESLQMFQELYGRMPTEEELIKFNEAAEQTDQKENENLNHEGSEEGTTSSQVDYETEIDALKKRLDDYEKTANDNMFSRITLNHTHWLTVIKFVMDNGLTNFLLIFIGMFIGIISAHMQPVSTKMCWYYLLFVLIIEYFYPLLSLKERFPWDSKLENWLKNTTYADIRQRFNSITESTASSFQSRRAEVEQKISNTQVADQDRPDAKEETVRQNVHPSNQQVGSIQTKTTYRVDLVSVILGIIELIAFFALPFVQMDVPIVGNMSVKLYDLLTNGESITELLGLDSTAFQIGLFILILCPILCVVASFIPNKGAHVANVVFSSVNIGYIVYVGLFVTGQVEEYLSNDYSSIVDTNYVGIGFWITMITPLLILIWSIILLVWKSISSK